MASLLKNIAEPYNKDKVYNTKDMALYNNLLYLCIYNNVSGEFDSSKWIEVQLTDLVQGKLRGIEDYSGKVVDASYVEQDDDYTYFGVPQKAFVDNETSFRTLNSDLNKELEMSNAVNISPKTNFTAPSNGVIIFAAMDTSTTIESQISVYMQIDGTKYNDFKSNQSSSGYYQGVMIKNVNKNSTIYCSNTGLEGYIIVFIPFS